MLALNVISRTLPLIWRLRLFESAQLQMENVWVARSLLESRIVNLVLRGGSFNSGKFKRKAPVGTMTFGRIASLCSVSIDG